MDAPLTILGRNSQARFVIDDHSNVGEVRRAAQALASHEFTVEIAGKVAIVATELATNIVRHAGHGELLLQCLGAEECAVIELLALDRGPGMANVERCMTDGYSTAGTSGTGLGAVRRLANEFDIHSAPGEGTVVMARFGKGVSARYGAINVPVEGEVHCGDAWDLVHGEEGTAVIVADGLGHGTFAAEAAQAALSVFSAAPYLEPAEILTRANAAMSKTLGGAAAVARIRADGMSYCGVGNISGSLVMPGRSQGLVSHNGTLGINQRRTQQFEYHREPGALLVMHSDGISARWELKSRTELFAHHPAIIAGTIYRDHARGHDDATVVVVA
jgi:anti-sigma regulatory factor (Ser/Thr protein kinase)